MSDLNFTQRAIVACDDFIQRANVRGPMGRDRACRDFMSGVLHVAVGENVSPQSATGLALITLGGYPRIHAMAADIRKGQTPALCAEEDK